MTYRWTPAEGLEDARAGKTLASPTSTTLYTLEATDPRTGFTTRTSVRVVVSPVPRVSLDLPPGSVNLGDPVTLAATSSVEGAFLWDLGDGATSSTPAPAHVYSAPGTYPVTLVVTSPEGCTGGASIALRVENMLPLPLLSFLASPLEGGVQFAWIAPQQPSLSGIVIVLSTTGVPQSPQDGTVVADLSLSSSPSSSYAIGGLSNGTTYYFAAFTTDALGRYGAPLDASAVPGAGFVDHFIVSLPSTPPIAGIPFTVVVTAVDILGQGVTGFAGTVSLADATGTASPSTVSTFSGGSASVQVAVTRSGAADSLSVSDGSGHTGQSASFSVAAGPLDHLVASVPPGIEVAGASFPLTATAYDAYGNVVPWGGIASLSDATGTVSPSGGLSFAQGGMTASVSVCRVGSSDRITVSTGGVSAQTAPFSVVPGSVLASLAVAPLPPSVGAGSSFSLTATAYDACGNVMTTYAGGATLSAATGTPTPSIGSFTGGYLSLTESLCAAPAAERLTVWSGGKSVATNVFSLTPGALASITSGSVAGSVGAGDSFPYQATAYDACGNVKTDYSGAASFTSPWSSVSPSSASFSSGTLSTILSVCGAPGSGAITLTSSSLPATTNVFSLLPGALGSLAAGWIGGPETAGAAFGFEATAYDVCGNVKTDYAGGATLSTTWAGVAPTLATFSAGTISTTVSVCGTPSTGSISVASSGQSASTNVFALGLGALGSVALGSVADPETAGASFAITATAYDVCGNVKTDYSGGASFGSTWGAPSPSSAAFAAGALSASLSVCGTPGSGDLTIATGGQGATSNVFTLGPGALGSIAAGGISSPQGSGESFGLQATAYDVCGNVKTDYAGSAAFTSTWGAVSPASGSFSGGALASTVSICGATVTGDVTITSGGRTATTDVFALGPGGSLAQIGVGTVSSSETAGQGFVLEATAYDGCGNVKTDYSGPATLTSSWASITPVDVSFSSGVFSTAVTLCGTAGTGTIQVTSGSVSGGSNSFSLVPGALGSVVAGWVGDPQAAGTAFGFTATAYDVCGNVKTDYAGSAAFTSTWGGVSPASATFSSGVASTALSICGSLATGDLTITTGGRSATSDVFSLVPGDLGSVAVGWIPDPEAAGAAFGFTATAYDVCGNVKTDYAGGATLTTGWSSISPSSVTFSAGSVTATISICGMPSAGDVTIATGGQSATSDVFSIGAGPLGFFADGWIPDPEAAGAAFGFTATAYDVCGNVKTDYAGGATLTVPWASIAPSGVTFASGVVSTTISICGAPSTGAVTLMSSAQSAVSNVFNLDLGALGSLAAGWIAGPQAAGATFGFTATAYDVCGNVKTDYAGGATLSTTWTSVSPTSVTFSAGTISTTVSVCGTPSSGTLSIASGGTSASTDLFSLTPGALGWFVDGWIPTPQTAGGGFPFSATAYDLCGNVKTDYAGAATLSSTWTSISPGAASFVSGLLNAAISVCGTPSTGTVSMTSSGQTVASNAFSLAAGGLDHLAFAGDPSGVRSCVAFPIVVTAFDACGNVSAVTGTANLTDATATLTPATAPIVSGFLTASVRIGIATAADAVTVTFGGKTTTSAPFGVTAPLDHLVAGPLPASVSGAQSFTVLATAYDACGSVANWSAPAALSDSTGSLGLLAPATFAAGSLSVSAYVCGAPATDAITVSSGGASTTTASMSILPFADAGPPQQMYTGGTVALGSPALAGKSYAWTPTGGLDDAAIAQPLASPTRGTTYTLQATDLSTGCVNAATTWVVVNVFVTGMLPYDGQLDFPVNATMLIVFSEPMDSSTLIPGNFVLTDGNTNALLCSPTLITYDPGTWSAQVYFPCLTQGSYPYLITVGPGTLTSTLGNAMNGPEIAGFSTAPTVDTQAPWVVQSFPACGATSVPLNTALDATYSEPMDPVTIRPTTVFVTSGAGTVTATVSYDIPSDTAFVEPATYLAALTVYTLETTGATDLSGNPVTDFKCLFTTGTTLDFTPPGVVSTFPAAGATNISPTTLVTATFDEQMSAITINTSSFTVTDATGFPVAGTVYYNPGATTAVFTPGAGLSPYMTYYVTLTSAMRDLAGNALPQTPWSFVTGNYVLRDPVPIGDTNFTPSGGWAESGVKYTSAPSSWADVYTAKSLNESLTSRLLDLTVLVSSATLSFRTIYSLPKGAGGGDQGFVEVSTNGGGTWTQVGATISGKRATWGARTISLTPYVGQQILLRFRLTSNNDNKFGNWYIDDINIAGQ